ncbi:ABC transporter ATP-binding protein [Thauera butanivorans]|uniref:ABC transporter ATP-binding protein n=1 Tax=Thauera butanivorans TaxID=86174 RepID=UPI0008395D4A|nr:ABC transporter ATP-binding protein [Thauera butanivorans]
MMASDGKGPARGHIDLRDIRVSFMQNGAALDAVSGVTLDVEPGEFVSVVGPSGCGKSTLLNIVAGFLKPSAGKAMVDGKPIDGPGSERGVVFQQYSLFPWLKVRENVEFGLRMQGMGRAERESKARTLLGLAGLLSFENHYPDQLSGGMKQRVGIVRALATGPQVLLMDEPFGALDAQTRVVMQEILTNMWQQLRLSVLFITHDIEESIFLSDKVYVMTARPGRIKAEIPIPLPRPRTPEMTASPTFMALHRQLKALIREESLAAMGGELRDGGLGQDWHLGSQDDVRAVL